MSTPKKKKMLPRVTVGDILESLGIAGGPRGRSALKIPKKRVKRDWQDVRLKDRNERHQLTEKFLENHYYRFSETPGKPYTYTYSKNGKIKAYTPFDGNKSGVEVKTFNNPTLKQLRDWMGY